MSGEALYERYKDALKRGHVASLKGRLEDALTAYAEAATIAPERSTPHTSAGTALMRRKRPADALRHFTMAVQLAPRDEAALLGRAQALVALDRRGDAASAYDALAEVRLASGKLADAVDAERRALELAEGRERRRNLQRLIVRLRESEPDAPGRAALEKALLVLDGVAMAKPAPATVPETPEMRAAAIAAAEAGAMAAAADAMADQGEVTTEEATDATEVAADEPVEPVEVAAGTAEAVETVEPAEEPAPVAAEAEPVEEAAAADSPAWVETELEAPVGDAGEVGEGGEAEPQAESEADAGPEAQAEPEVEAEPDPATADAEAEPAPEPVPVPVFRPALDRELPTGFDLVAVAQAADAALDRRDRAGALNLLLDVATAHRRAGATAAAIDACYVALSVAPDDVVLHLALVELYSEHGWVTLAGEKLGLLERLTELDGDAEARARVAAARAGGS